MLLFDLIHKGETELRIRRIIVIIFVVLVLLLSVAEAETGSSLNQEVPFGITTSKNGQYIPVFDRIGSNNKTDLLMPGQLCALDFAKLESANYWYHIVYYDDDGEAQAGYVKESNFEPLVMSDLTRMMKDPEVAEQIDQYLELAETSPLFLGGQEISREQKDSGRQYVLNTNTMKFHYPNCKSVKQMKEKNRKDYTGDREYLIEVGYVPCKNCNP